MVSKKLKCNNTFRIVVNGVNRVGQIFDLIAKYPEEVWHAVYSKGSGLSLCSSCYHELKSAIRKKAPHLIEDLEKPKRKKMALEKAKKFYGLN